MNKYSPIVSEFGSAEEEESYLRWLTTRVEQARADTRPRLAHDEVMAEMRGIIASKSSASC